MLTLCKSPQSIALFIVTSGLLLSPTAQPADQRWTKTFEIAADDWASTGRNPYFILEPGYTLVLENGSERLTISVLDETRLVDNVETRVVEERETNHDEVVEVSRNFFAWSRRTGSIFYFGEEVDEFKGGKIVGHAGAWRSGENGAHFGLMIPGLPLLGSRYYQEYAPRVAMDRAEIVSLTDTLKTPAGEFKNVVRIAETTPLEPGVREFKYYAANVGLIQDGSLKLVKYSR